MTVIDVDAHYEPAADWLDEYPSLRADLPELLPKNDRAFALFALAHKTLAYTLLALVTLHVMGVLKHRFLDRGRAADVLPRML